MCENVFLYFVHCVHAVTFYMFSTLISLEDRLIFETESENNYLRYGYNAGSIIV